MVTYAQIYFKIYLLEMCTFLSIDKIFDHKSTYTHILQYI